MVDKYIGIDINDILELEYLIEEVTDDVISVNSGTKSDLGYISKKTTVLDPTSTGTYKLDINGKKVNISVFERIDDFEDEVLYRNSQLSDYYSDSYNGGLSNFERVNTTILQGDYALKSVSSGSSHSIVSNKSDGLPYYPQIGDTFSYLLNFQSDNNDNLTQFGYNQSSGDRYMIRFGNNQDVLEIEYVNNGNRDRLDAVNISPSTNTDYEIEIQWNSDNTITVTAYEVTVLGDFIIRDNKVATASGNQSINYGRGIIYAVACLNSAEIYQDFIRKL